MYSNFDDIQVAGSDTRPLILDRTDYDSWSQRIRLYCRGKENEIYILQSIDHGPFELGTNRDTLGTTPEGGVLLGPKRPRTYDDLNDNEKKRFDADVRATNIVFQGLPKDIYKLINHNIEAKAIWDNVKMFLARSELTKEDRESQLYDEFKRFKMLLGENINEYYVWFHKLVNDIRNIRMTMPNIQLNSKFVNNMSPEWDRFVTSIKLNKGLKETNHEQLYAYLKQHEKHATQDRLIIERITPTTNDQLAFVSSVQPYTQLSPVQSHQYPPSSAPLLSPHVQSLLEMVQLAMREHILKLGMSMQNGVVLNEEELLFLTREQTNNFNADVDDHPVSDLTLNDDNIFQADECDAFDSDVDDEPTAQSIFMANLSSAGPTNQQVGPSNASILSEVHDLENAIYPCDDNQDEHEIHNEVQQKNIIDSTRDHMGNSNVTPYEQYLSVNDVSVVSSCESSVSNDAYVLHDNDAYIPHDPLVTKLNIYMEQVAIYKQRARFELTLQVRAMKTVFENLEAKVDQNAIDLKSVSRFFDMDEALNAAQKRIAKLESKNSNLQNKIQNDDHDVMVQSRGNTIRELREKISRLTTKHSEAVPINDRTALDSQTRFDNNVSFEEEVVYQRLPKTLTHVLELSSCIYLDDRAWGVLNFDSAGVRKEREPPLRVRALVMTIGLDLSRQILNAQTEARKPENIKKEDVGDCDHARVP
nr:putative zinc finger, CCHC-type [Tanacetum cinerariifolium]